MSRRRGIASPLCPDSGGVTIPSRHAAYTRRCGFTLIELLTVIAVIVILAAILIPVVGKVRDLARKSAAASNASQIAKAYQIYATQGGRERTINATDIYDWARHLAQEADLNDPRLYILAEDPLVEMETRPMPQLIATPPADGQGDWTVTEGFQGYPISFAVANRLPVRSNSRTPVVWTRGLQSSGVWRGYEDSNPGVYGSEGGHIAFADGSVQFYTDLSEGGGQLVADNQQTADITKALGPNGQVLESTPASEP